MLKRPSDDLKETRIYQNEPALRTILQRYQMWTPEKWAENPRQLSFDIGVLLGLIHHLDNALEYPSYDNLDFRQYKEG